MLIYTVDLVSKNLSSTGYRILFWLLFSRSFSTRFLVINSEMLRSMINKRIKNNLQNRRYDKDESDENRSISVDIFHHTASGNEKKMKMYSLQLPGFRRNNKYYNRNYKMNLKVTNFTGLITS